MPFSPMEIQAIVAFFSSFASAYLLTDDAGV